MGGGSTGAWSTLKVDPRVLWGCGVLGQSHSWRTMIPGRPLTIGRSPQIICMRATHTSSHIRAPLAFSGITTNRRTTSSAKQFGRWSACVNATGSTHDPRCATSAAFEAADMPVNSAWTPFVILPVSIKLFLIRCLSLVAFCLCVPNRIYPVQFVRTSVAVLAETSLRSPRKIFFFITKKSIFIG